MIHLLIEIIGFQLVFLLVYDLFLKKETFFQWNRLYLMGTFFSSLFLPLIKIKAFREVIPVGRSWKATYIQQLNEISLSSKPPALAISWPEILYWSGLVVFLLLLVRKLYVIYLLRKSGQKSSFPEYTRIDISNSSIAFSFFRDIFIGDRLPLVFQKQIVAHELVHVRQRHSYDLIFFEVMRIIQWYNPLVYIFQSRIAELHEYIADEDVPLKDRRRQFELLLSSVFDTKHISFINQFFKSSLIKKRIVMLKKSRSSKFWKFKYLVLVPVLICMLCYSSCQEEDHESAANIMQVQDVENLSQEEEEALFKELNALSNSHSQWNFTVQDANTTLRFYEADGDSYITGPNNERINAQMILEGEVSDNFGNAMFGKSEKVPFGLVEQVPVFPGCENAEDTRACFNQHLQEHIRKNFRYPQEAIDQGIQGRVNILFTIDQYGKVTGIRKRGPSEYLENEAVRIIEKLPQMKPGMQQGAAVQVPYSIPITFRLSN